MNELLFLGNLGTGEIVIIAIVVLLLFGGKKIPELMKGIGKGVKNFKDGVKGLGKTIKSGRYENSRRCNKKKSSPLGSLKNPLADFTSFYFSALCFMAMF